MLNLDTLIEQATEARGRSKIGGNTAVCVCFQGIPYLPMERFLLDEDQDGAIALVFPKEQNEVQAALDVTDPSDEGSLDALVDHLGGICQSLAGLAKFPGVREAICRLYADERFQTLMDIARGEHDYADGNDND